MTEGRKGVEPGGANAGPDRDGTRNNLARYPDVQARKAAADLALEEAVIACVIIDPESISLAMEAGVRANTFSHAAPRRIWEAMQRLRGRGIPIDTVTLPPEVAGQLEGVQCFLARVCTEVPCSTRIKFYAAELVARARSRDTKMVLIEAAEQLDAGENVDDVLADTRDRIRQIGGQR